MMILILLTVVVIISLIYCLSNKVEHFQYIITDDKSVITPIEYVFTQKKDVIIKTPITDYDSCAELCRQTPNCKGFNYALNDCTLYRKLDKPPRNGFYRNW